MPQLQRFRLIENGLRPGCREIQVVGEVDLVVAERLKDVEQAAAGHDQILIGMQRCEFIDSTAIAVIVRAHTSWRRGGSESPYTGAQSRCYESFRSRA